MNQENNNKFLSQEAARLDPYTPGEQPRDQKYIKLNTNESPFPPSPKVLEALAQETSLNLYSDPTCKILNDAIAKRYHLKPENIITGNGSDEILAFAFRAFCGQGKRVAYPDITYGFYKAQVALFNLDATVIPLREDFTVSIEDYIKFPGTIFLANPNAPTGIALKPSEIQKILESNLDRVVIIDEAYVDFGAESCVPLIPDFDNLLVVQTMSKSRQLAGGRVGFAMGSPDLISALNRVKYSFNPYNVNRMSLVAGAAAIEDEAYFQSCQAVIQENRAWTEQQLRDLGFRVLPSSANFVFAGEGPIRAEDLYRRLKAEGILIRWWENSGRIENYTRITIGSRENMEALINAVRKLLAEN